MRSEDLALEELTTGIKLVFTPKRGMVLLTGCDALPFIERMSTNKVTTLEKDHPIATVFVDNKGHIVDHCVLFLLEKEKILLVSSYENAANLLTWLEQFHFVEDFSLKKTNDFELSFIFFAAGSSSTSLKKPFLKCGQIKVQGVFIDIYAVLNDVFEDKKIIDEEWWQTLRIMALMPLYPSEINQRWMPQNVGLKNFIAENKGCYIGQEVISKALTYQKNVKNLCGLKVSHEEFHNLKVQTLVKDPNGRIGETTSVAPIYLPNEINALLIEGIKTSEKVFLESKSFFEIKNRDKSF